jgi:Tfp pilus assembly protein PilF
MNPKRLLSVAALPLALMLAGCESAPVKGVQKIFDSVTGSGSADTSTTRASNPPQVIASSDRASSAGSRGGSDLQVGVARYEDGQYAEASARLQSALAAGLTAAESVRAHKYLAFIHCASKRERQCRTEFRKAIAIDPGFQLNAAESGHPIWGPVFREVKQRG